MVIDANVYWLPEELFTDPAIAEAFLRCVPQEYDVRASAHPTSDGDIEIRIEKPLGCENLNYFGKDYAMERQLADMDAAGVDKAILKLPGCQEWLNLDMCRLFNDAAAAHVKESGGRMETLAVVPPYGDTASLAELDRCVNELGMRGVQMSAHYGNHYLDNPMFRPMFQHINDLGIPVYVHHTPVPVDCSTILEYNNLRRSFGRCQDQIVAIGRELFSDMFAELPNVKLIHSMLGGGYFTFKDMLMPRDSGGRRFDTNTETIKKYLAENIYFELSHAQPWGKEPLELAVKILGADHIVYGSSYPVKQVWMTKGPSFVRTLNISEEDKKMILGGNAQRLYQV